MVSTKLMGNNRVFSGDLMKKNKMSALFINDLDAGAGRFGESTQYTVNNQMVNATLMNIADNPTNVQLPGVYKSEECPRIPIICTGVSEPVPGKSNRTWYTAHCCFRNFVASQCFTVPLLRRQ